VITISFLEGVEGVSAAKSSESNYTTAIRKIYV
jgi:hypothetical protein